ncbi:BspA family leucine-rich repeat surface protein [Flavobacterium sp. K5-23]|uniref:BspA family leucine-rich repeat surface protein n=1 Tax=Flavobacterium sp. K5-23 TaxID=2746225 RepID=UPI00200C36BB|nr:BspA family leucine-rich repeat surface protein [Flavobacterium sp. K5-23]
MFKSINAFNQDISGWDVSNVTNMSFMFAYSPTYNQPLNAWGSKTSKVTTMHEMFRGAALFNQDLSSWDVSKVTTMFAMFYGATNFNQDLSSWNVSSVVNMQFMFFSANAFNGNITNWNVSNVTNMLGMFQNATNFNQNIGVWNVSNVTTMSSMFNAASNFNQDISGWNVSNVTTMANMFQSANSFNQNIGIWNVGNVTTMASMFLSNTKFNQNISGWNVIKVTNMANMFAYASVFNQPLNGWGTKTGSVTNMQEMFRQAILFNQDINSWDVSKVTTTVLMFYLANNFNQNLNFWDVSNLVNPSRMFEGNTAFNGNISNWNFTSDLAKTVNMSSMFNGATAFNQNIGNWNMKRVNNISTMFQNATKFNQNIGSWDISSATLAGNFLSGGKLSRNNYDALLLGWSSLDPGETSIPSSLTIHFGTSKYSNEPNIVAARAYLTDTKGWTITDGDMESDLTAPIITTRALASNNSTFSVTFSKRVYNTAFGTGNLTVSSFAFSLTGGVATLSSTTPISLSTTDNITFTLGIGFSVPANGTETITISPVVASIFDFAGNEATVVQSNNTANLYDLTPAIITGPSSSTGSTSSISLPENKTPVFTFTANEAVTWSLGTSGDWNKFSINSSGIVSFISAPDFETPNSINSSNIYVLDVKATDATGNISTQNLTITVTDVAPATLSNFNSIVKTSFESPFNLTAPTTNSTGAIIYTSSNPSVATISGTTVNYVGSGVSTITASQAYDEDYDNQIISAILTITSVSVVTKNGQITGTNPTFVNKNGAINTNFGINKNGESKQINSSDLAPGIFLHLDASNITSYSGSGTAWNDLSGNGNNGTLKNGVSYSSSNNGFLIFDGTNDYVVTDTNLDLSSTDKLTIQLILKTASTATAMVLEHSVDWNSNNAFGILSTSNKMQITDHNQNYNVYNSVAAINDNNWHLLSTTMDRSLGANDQSLIYIDGNAPNKVNVPGLNSDNNGNFTSHKLYLSSRAGSAHFYSGNIAQVLIYKRVLTADEILQNFNAVKIKYGL